MTFAERFPFYMRPATARTLLAISRANHERIKTERRRAHVRESLAASLSRPAWAFFPRPETAVDFTTPAPQGFTKELE